MRIDERGDVRFRWQKNDVHVPLRGRHNARNALIALGVAREWGVDQAQALAALTQLKPAKMRGEWHDLGKLTIIADCYNSNPASLASAIDLLEALPQQRRRVAVLGSMLELGPSSGQLHEQAARQIAQTRIDLIVATGEFVPAFQTLHDDLADRLILERDPLESWSALRARLRGDEIVLLKGSRGVALERLLPRLQEFAGTPPAQGVTS